MLKFLIEFVFNFKVWNALLKKMPMTAMIRNLNKMTAVGLLKENNEQVQSVCQKLRNENLLKKARIHPFNVLLALKQYESGRGDKGSLKWKANPIITKALEDAFYLSFKVGWVVYCKFGSITTTPKSV
jgi:60 kDa SS-A/Ro ribonucleoprotein